MSESFGEFGTATPVVFWSMFLLNPLLLSLVDVYLVRRHRYKALWGVSIALVVICGVGYLLIRNPNSLGRDPTYVGDYRPIWQDPAQLLPPPFYFGLPALLIARACMRANAAESWSEQFRRTRNTAFFSLLLAFPLGFFVEVATHKGAWL